jgi:hypothetical protein
VRRLRGSLSFSNIVAVAALFFALGGTVYAAGKISGSQIKPGSIPGNRIKNKSLTGKQIKPGSLTGTQIKGSSLTGVSAASLGAVQYVSVVVPISPGVPTGSTGIAACPAGKKVIGGGATVNNQTYAFINESAPTLERNGWLATGFSGITGVSMTITAICTSVTAPVG